MVDKRPEERLELHCTPVEFTQRLHGVIPRMTKQESAQASRLSGSLCYIHHLSIHHGALS